MPDARRTPTTNVTSPTRRQRRLLRDVAGGAALACIWGVFTLDGSPIERLHVRRFLERGWLRIALPDANGRSAVTLTPAGRIWTAPSTRRRRAA
jgi:hypothetical protein